MEFEIPEEHRMIKDLVARFVREELIPLEPTLLAREAQGGGISLTAQGRAGLGPELRRIAPSIPIYGNLGAIQLVNGMGLDEARRAVDQTFLSVPWSVSMKRWVAPSFTTTCRPTRPIC